MAVKQPVLEHVLLIVKPPVFIPATMVVQTMVINMAGLIWLVVLMLDVHVDVSTVAVVVVKQVVRISVMKVVVVVARELAVILLVKVLAGRMFV
jgi:hypothetical protein